MSKNYQEDNEEVSYPFLKTDTFWMISHIVGLTFVYLFPLVLVLFLNIYLQYIILTIYIFFTIKRLYKGFEMILKDSFPIPKLMDNWGNSHPSTPYHQRHLLALKVREMITETVVMFLFAFMVFSYQAMENKLVDYKYDSYYSDGHEQ